MTTYIKWLNADGTPCNGGSGQWHMPSGKRPGKWMPAVKPIPCKQGYHVCTPDQALKWIGPSAWLVEIRGEVIDHGDKTVAEQARLVRRLNWDDDLARLFAADCAERALHIFERDYPVDRRPRTAIEVARAFVAGDATDEDLAAARAAARDAARAAVGAAAGDAAWDAARAAAGAAAGDAERRWQADHLMAVLGVDG